MRKLIRKLIKEKFEGFGDFNDLDIDLLDYTDMEEEDKKQISLYAYTSLMFLSEKHRLIPAMHYFASLEDMKNYISTWDGTNCTRHAGDYEIAVWISPAYRPESVHKKLFSYFPQADSIKINVFDNKEYVDFDGMTHINKAMVMCKYIQHYTDGMVRETHLFDDSDQPTMSGYYLLQKDSGITYTPK
jgi:hypothetical protein